jgi:hypothetical protein
LKGWEEMIALGLIKRFVEDASRMDRVEWLILGAILAVALGGYIAVAAPSVEPPAVRMDSQH